MSPGFILDVYVEELLFNVLDAVLEVYWEDASGVGDCLGFISAQVDHHEINVIVHSADV